MDDQSAAPGAEDQAPETPPKHPEATPPPTVNPAAQARSDAAGEAADAEAEVRAPAEQGAPEAPEAAEAETPPVAVHIEHTGPCKRLVRIEVCAEKVKQEIDTSYDELRKTVFIKGFRTGHVPRHILERRFGEQVLESVQQALVEENFAKAVEDHSLNLALQPDLDPKAFKLELGQPFQFQAEVEVTPEFTIEGYKELAVERPAVVVTDKDVTQALDAFRMRHGESRTLEEGQVAEGDVALCHASALHNGEEIWRQDTLGALVRDESLAGMSIPGLRDALVGAEVGDTRTLQVTLPDDFTAEEHRGKEVDLEVTIDAIRRFEAPEATDEWAESLNFDGLEDLREELHDELRREREQQADDTVQERIAGKLLQLTDFDVPEGLVDRLVASTQERRRLALLYRGVPRDEIDKRLEADDARTRQDSTRSCKLYFIYNKIAEQEKLFVTEDEVQQRIQAIALNYRRRPQEIQAELEAEGRLSSLRHQMREEKVRDFLVQHAHIRDEGQPAPDVAAQPAPQGESPATIEPADDEAEAAEGEAEAADS